MLKQSLPSNPARRKPTLTDTELLNMLTDLSETDIFLQSLIERESESDAEMERRTR
jgi:hypothetical protein